MPINLTDGTVYSDLSLASDNVVYANCNQGYATVSADAYSHTSVEARISKLEKQLKETNEKLDKIIALENLWPTKNDN